MTWGSPVHILHTCVCTLYRLPGYHVSCKLFLLVSYTLLLCGSSDSIFTSFHFTHSRQCVSGLTGSHLSHDLVSGAAGCDPCSRGLPPNQPMEMLHQRSQYIVEVIASDNNIQIHLRKWMNFQFPLVLPAPTAALLISQDIYLVTYYKTKATRNKTIITRTQLSDNRLSWSGSHLVQLLG